jgi:hypothetical protein
MLQTLRFSVLGLLWLYVALACNAQDSADQQIESLNVHRLPNGFVEVTAAQQVYCLLCCFDAKIDCESILFSVFDGHFLIL